MSINLKDSSGQVWRFDITDQGMLTSTLTSEIAASPQVLADFYKGDTLWTLGATTIGQITTTAAGAAPYGTPNRIGFISSGGYNWDLIITTQGILQSLFGSNPTVPALGTLVSVGISYPQPVQPGGPGTPVTDPVQTQGQMTGRFYLGCGHSVNSLEVRKYASGNNLQVALLCCPMCGYVQRIISPYSEIYNSNTNPYLIA